ncbi:MAG: hypothetical protein JOY68_05325, partial [Candidatus Dormibacteraeota bacterium]|nr:hypothetical protein [Candidatus Dormibacteraeota bacterium]
DESEDGLSASDGAEDLEEMGMSTFQAEGDEESAGVDTDDDDSRPEDEY